MLDYYKHIDAQLGELMALAGDDVTVIVVSDHGGKAMRGSLNLNEWLLNEGYLVLKEPVSGVTRFKEENGGLVEDEGVGLGRVLCARVHERRRAASRRASSRRPTTSASATSWCASCEAIPDDQGQPMATQGAQARGPLLHAATAGRAGPVRVLR